MQPKILAVVLYHRIGKGKLSTPLERVEQHFQELSRFPSVVPGDPLEAPLSVCITLDDASFDLYHDVFPLLKKYHLKALVAIPTLYIVESTTVSAETRLKVPYYLAMQEGIYETSIPFCTYEELREMLQEGCITIASHSHSHPNLCFDFVKLDREIKDSKEILEKKLGVSVDSFVYPFGKVNSTVEQHVKEQYRYSFRIGGFFNQTWSTTAPLGRIPLDGQREVPFLHSWRKKMIYTIKGLWNAC